MPAGPVPRLALPPATPGAITAMDSALCASGSCFSCSEVITEDWRVEDTSIAGSELAVTVTLERFCTFLPASAAANGTWAPPLTLTDTWSREATTLPPCISDTV